MLFAAPPRKAARHGREMNKSVPRFEKEVWKCLGEHGFLTFPEGRRAAQTCREAHTFGPMLPRVIFRVVASLPAEYTNATLEEARPRGANLHAMDVRFGDVEKCACQLGVRFAVKRKSSNGRDDRITPWLTPCPQCGVYVDENDRFKYGCRRFMRNEDLVIERTVALSGEKDPRFELKKEKRLSYKQIKTVYEHWKVCKGVQNFVPSIFLPLQGAKHASPFALAWQKETSDSMLRVSVLSGQLFQLNINAFLDVASVLKHVFGLGKEDDIEDSKLFLRNEEISPRRACAFLDLSQTFVAVFVPAQRRTFHLHGQFFKTKTVNLRVRRGRLFDVEDEGDSFNVVDEVGLHEEADEHFFYVRELQEQLGAQDEIDEDWADSAICSFRDFLKGSSNTLRIIREPNRRRIRFRIMEETKNETTRSVPKIRACNDRLGPDFWIARCVDELTGESKLTWDKRLRQL